MNINPWIALLIFVMTALLDILHASYTRAVIDRKPMAAAIVGSMTYLISAFSVIQYTKSPIYIGFLVLGSFFGNYAFVRLSR